MSQISQLFHYPGAPGQWDELGVVATFAAWSADHMRRVAVGDQLKAGAVAGTAGSCTYICSIYFTAKTEKVWKSNETQKLPNSSKVDPVLLQTKYIESKTS